MSNNEENSTDTTESGAAAQIQNSGGRRPALRFIGVFVISVMLLLTGYRYSINTTLNDWYLFFVAQNTASVLGWIGDSCVLERGQGVQDNPAEVRAYLDAWARGENAPTQEEVERASKAPLKASERWLHRVQRMRRSGHRGQVGPHVSFVLRYGIDDRIDLLNGQIEQVRRNAGLSEPDRASQVALLEDQLRVLRETQAVNQRTPEKKRDNRGYHFPFIVVSECGAIEVMAIFFAAVIAFPTRWWRRLAGIVLGIPLMYAVNIFRLTCLGVIGALDSSRQWFEFAHYYAWQAIYIVFVVAVWLAWVEFVVREGGPGEQGFFRNLVHGLNRTGKIWRVAFFCIKFLVFVSVLVAAWWLFLPYYGYVLVQAAGGILRHVMGVPIIAGWIETGGVLNTDSWLFFAIEGVASEKKTPIALLITNLPPYLALVLATPGLRWAKRLRILLYGSGIIMLGHVLFLVIVLRYQEALQEYSELPVAVMQFYLTLPFLLWVVFAYWQRIFGVRNRKD